MKRFFFRYFPPLFWAIIIFILSSIPGKEYPEIVFNYSYIAHFAEFFILSILVLRALGTINRKTVYLSLTICVFYALTDEIHQIFVSDRSISLLDWLIDFLGIIVGIKFRLGFKTQPNKFNK